MSPKTRDAARTKAAIMEAGRRLFAERDIAAVSIRDIAAAAGVSHGLVQHHFGTREQLVAAIVRQEVAELAAATWAIPADAAGADRERLRAEIKAGLARFRDYARLIVRAELAGAEPEKLLDPDVSTPAQLLAGSIRELQRRTEPGPGAPDPALLSAYVNAALFGFAALAPWLMTSVGLEPRDYEARLDEIVDLTLRLIGLAGERSPEA